MKKKVEVVLLVLLLLVLLGNNNCMSGIIIMHETLQEYVAARKKKSSSQRYCCSCYSLGWSLPEVARISLCVLDGHLVLSILFMCIVTFVVGLLLVIEALMVEDAGVTAQEARYY